MYIEIAFLFSSFTFTTKFFQYKLNTKTIKNMENHIQFLNTQRSIYQHIGKKFHIKYT